MLYHEKLECSLHLQGDVHDESGRGRNGTGANITFADGPFGQHLVFNGSSSQVSIPLPAMGSFAFAVRASGTGVVFASWINSSNLVALQINSDTDAIFYAKDGGSNYLSFTGTGFTAAGTWLCTFNATGGVMTVLRNAVQIATTTGKTSSGIVTNNNFLGRRHDGNYLNGTISWFNIWSIPSIPTSDAERMRYNLHPISLQG